MPEDRWVFVHSGADAHDHYWVSERDNLHSSPAIAACGRAALGLAGIGIDDVAHVDLYSCFPSAVQIGAGRPSGSASTGRSPSPAGWASPAARGTTT